MRKFLFVLAAFLAVALVAGCAAQSQAVKTDAPAEESMATEGDAAPAGDAVVPADSEAAPAGDEGEATEAAPAEGEDESGSEEGAEEAGEE